MKDELNERCDGLGKGRWGVEEMVEEADSDLAVRQYPRSTCSVPGSRKRLREEKQGPSMEKRPKI